MNGFLNLLKPPGMTSSDAVVAVRRTLAGEKTGHAGTLDPEAAGVLPIMIGKAARLFDVLADKEKEYIAEICMGCATDTQDAQGTVTHTGAWKGDWQALRDAMPALTGESLQTPPQYSALKVGGKPAYRLARGGETAQLAPRPVRVDAIEFLEATGPDTALLRIACGRGVYVRTLCHDLGARAGCPAHMRFLLRTRTGAFCLEDAVTLEEWMAAEDRSALLTPLDAPICHLPRADVAARFAGACRNGAAMQSFEALDEGAREGGPVRVYCGGVFAGLARWREGALRFQAMLMD